MSTPSLGRLLISHITLRGPELRQLYELIEGHPLISYDDVAAATTVVALTSAFGLEEAPLREALNFLLVAGMVEQVGPSRRKANFRVTPRLQSMSFPLLLLHHTLSHADERQRAPALIYRELVADDELAVTQPAIRDRMERGSIGELFAWTSEKITFWTHLMDHIGLVRRLDRSTEVLIVPQPALVLTALSAVATQADGLHSLDTLLHTIDERFFACYTRRGRIHRGLAQSLLALERTGRIQLSHSADALRSLLLGERRVSEVRIVLLGGTRS